MSASRGTTISILGALLLAVLLLGCEEEREKRPLGGGGLIPGGSSAVPVTTDGGDEDGAPTDARPDHPPSPDGPASCEVDCDCAQGLRCTNAVCTEELSPFYCCDKPGCPTGQLCTDTEGLPGLCPS